MSIVYPRALPSALQAASVRLTTESTVGMSESPFTRSQQAYVWSGERWRADVTLRAMKAATAKSVIAWLLSLNGMEGTFLMGDLSRPAQDGTWSAGSPGVVVDGAHAAGVRAVALKNFTAGATGIAGDYIQIGFGSNAHLHMLLQDFTADGSGLASVDLWPRTRAALANNENILTSGAVGLWRLASNESSWAVRRGKVYEVAFSAIEALEG